MRFSPLDAENEHRSSALSFFRSMFKLGDFLDEIKKAFETRGLDRLGDELKPRGGIPIWGDGERERWLKDGVECEILKPGSKIWQKGKLRIKISFEFCPDQSDKFLSDPSLEEIRQIANIDKQE